MTDPADLTLVELLPLLASRALSARELLDACLARIEVHEAAVQAFVRLTPELARAAAERADQARASGRPVGPLAGVPVALKDLYLTRGVPTTCSSRVLEGHDPGIDAEVWRRLSVAGAGLLGKTTLHEFAFGTGSHPTRNPWDLSRTPGGSSGGSAAALAARMVPVATGSDTGGSLRIPAAACGVSSLRPTYGRVSTYGTVPLSPSFDVAGPMARRMLDVSLLLRLLAGHDPRVPGSIEEPVPDYAQAVREDLRGVRIGLPTRVFWDDVDDRIAAGCRAGLALLAEHGAELVDVDPPVTTEEVLAFPGTYGRTMGAEALALHATWLEERRHLYGAAVLERFRTSADTTPEQYEQARRERAQWAADWRAVFAAHRLDALAHPTIPQPPASVESGSTPTIALAKAWAINGFPALSVPVGLDDRGLPVGLQLAALPEQEGDLVAYGITLDETVQLWRRRPPR